MSWRHLRANLAVGDDTVDRDFGRKKSLKKGKSVENLIEVTGGESQDPARGASDMRVFVFPVFFPMRSNGELPLP
jgi:hypothetical protein